MASAAFLGRYGYEYMCALVRQRQEVLDDIRLNKKRVRAKKKPTAGKGRRR